MFPSSDNPAQRLLELLKAASTAPGNQQISQVWATTFGIKMDVPTFYRVAGHLIYLVDSVEVRIKQIPSLNHSLYLRDIPILRGIVSPAGMHVPWDSVKGPLSTGALTALEFCANELGKIHSEERIAQEEIARLKREFGQLLNDVSNSGVSFDIKTVLLDLLTSAVIALDQYKILGNEGLKKAVAYAIGTITLHKKQFIDSKGQEVVHKVMQTMHSLGGVISAAYKVKELTGGFPDLLKLLDK